MATGEALLYPCTLLSIFLRKHFQISKPKILKSLIFTLFSTIIYFPKDLVFVFLN